MLDVKGNSAETSQLIKCLVWDLDETLWRGVLTEGGGNELGHDVESVLQILDERGILHSIASKNDHAVAIQNLQRLNVSDYFLYPQINWGSKADAIVRIAEELGIGLNSIALIDDQAFERDEVRFYLPEVTTIDTAELSSVVQMACMNPALLSSESRSRRAMYQADARRKQSEQSFIGSRAEFLATLQMCLTVRRAERKDLYRAGELIVRTNQLNTTGRPYSFDELVSLLSNENIELLLVELTDKYGPSGIVGLALLNRSPVQWTINLFIMSCRVISRGIGTVFLSYILIRAKQHRVRLLAEFTPTDRNRVMYMTYKFIGFREVRTLDRTMLLEHSLTQPQALPSYISFVVPEGE